MAARSRTALSTLQATARSPVRAPGGGYDLAGAPDAIPVAPGGQLGV
jgi:hypothetical protein